MSNIKLFTACVMSVAVLAGCASKATNSPVIQRANQVFETTGLGATKLKAQQNALDSAKKQCGMRSPVIIEDTTTYNGMMDEKTGRMVEQGIGILGAIMGKSSPKIGRDDDYEYNIKFKCQ